MSVDFYFQEDPLDHAVLSNYESRAFDAHHLPAVHALYLVDAVCRCHLSFGIGEQLYIQKVFISEPGLLLNVVRADAYDNGSSLLNLDSCIPEPGCLPRSTGRISLRIEEQYDFLPAGVIAEIYLLAMVVLQRKGWCSASYFKHRTSGQGMN